MAILYVKGLGYYTPETLHDYASAHVETMNSFPEDEERNQHNLERYREKRLVDYALARPKPPITLAPVPKPH